MLNGDRWHDCHTVPYNPSHMARCTALVARLSDEQELSSSEIGFFLGLYVLSSISSCSSSDQVFSWQECNPCILLPAVVLAGLIIIFTGLAFFLLTLCELLPGSGSDAEVLTLYPLSSQSRPLYATPPMQGHHSPRSQVHSKSVLYMHVQDLGHTSPG
jgi:hypothetical protein